jgi:hypothetical protein
MTLRELAGQTRQCLKAQRRTAALWDEYRQRRARGEHAVRPTAEHDAARTLERRLEAACQKILYDAPAERTR